MLEKLDQVLREIGSEIRSWKKGNAVCGDWQGDQLKTAADWKAHQRIVEELARLAPAVPVISEEDLSGRGGQRPSEYWLIDPIDGTRSYAEGFPGYVTQVALMRSHRPVMAAVFAPHLDELFLAERGGGATRNGTPISVCTDSKRKILIDNSPEPQGTAKEAYLALGLTNYVECGSISLKICRVADGTADLFFKDVIVRDWDIAAPNLVIEEAGGRLTSIDGTLMIYRGSFEKPGIVVAAFPEIADELITWLNARGDRRPSENQLEDRQA